MTKHLNKTTHSPEQVVLLTGPSLPPAKYFHYCSLKLSVARICNLSRGSYLFVLQEGSLALLRYTGSLDCSVTGKDQQLKQKSHPEKSKLF